MSELIEAYNNIIKYVREEKTSDFIYFIFEYALAEDAPFDQENDLIFDAAITHFYRHPEIALNTLFMDYGNSYETL